MKENDKETKGQDAPIEVLALIWSPDFDDFVFDKRNLV